MSSPETAIEAAIASANRYCSSTRRAFDEQRNSFMRSSPEDNEYLGISEETQSTTINIIRELSLHATRIRDLLEAGEAPAEDLRAITSGFTAFCTEVINFTGAIDGFEFNEETLLDMSEINQLIADINATRSVRHHVHSTPAAAADSNPLEDLRHNISLARSLVATLSELISGGVSESDIAGVLEVASPFLDKMATISALVERIKAEGLQISAEIKSDLSSFNSVLIALNSLCKAIARQDERIQRALPLVKSVLSAGADAALRQGPDRARDVAEVARGVAQDAGIKATKAVVEGAKKLFRGW